MRLRGDKCTAICEFRFESTASITMVPGPSQAVSFNPLFPSERKITILISDQSGGRERGLPRPHLEETELGFEPRPFPHYIQQLCSHPWLTQKPRPNRHSAPENMGKAVPEQSKNLPSRIGRRCDDSGHQALRTVHLNMPPTGRLSPLLESPA